MHITRSLLLAIALTATSANAAIIDLIQNGGFESGAFNSWIAQSSNGSGGGCNVGWTVGTSGFATGCVDFEPYDLFVGPYSGQFAAYNSFDGDGPKTLTLQQSFNFLITTPITHAELSWWDAIGFGSGYVFNQPREFSVDLMIDGVQYNLFSQSFLMTGEGLFQSWELTSLDLTSLFASLSAGQHSGTLSFKNYIPESFTGPASFGLDDVRLFIDSTPQQTIVPEPTSIALLGFGLIGFGAFRRIKTKSH